MRYNIGIHLKFDCLKQNLKLAYAKKKTGAIIGKIAWLKLEKF